MASLKSNFLLLLITLGIIAFTGLLGFEPLHLIARVLGPLAKVLP